MGSPGRDGSPGQRVRICQILVVGKVDFLPSHFAADRLLYMGTKLGVVYFLLSV